MRTSGAVATKGTRGCGREAQFVGDISRRVGDRKSGTMCFLLACISRGLFRLPSVLYGPPAADYKCSVP